MRYIAAGPQFRLGGGNEGRRRFPCAAFSKLPTHRGIPCGNAGFLTSSGVLCGVACAAMRKSKKLWPRYSMTHIIMEPALYEPARLEMLVQGEVGRNNAGRSAARAAALSSGSSRTRSSTSRSGLVRNCATPCKQARRLLTSSTRFSRRPPTTARRDSLALPNANGVEANPRHTQDRPVIATACQTHVSTNSSCFLPIFRIQEEQRSDVL